MIFIQKNPTREAKEALNAFIKLEGDNAHYSNFKKSDGKDKVQESLLEEQAYLCAYCMRRINTAEKIEHWNTQEASKESANPHETLDYTNMLAVCDGKTQKIEHCDSARSKSNRVLTINPTNKQTILQVKYLRNGTICSDNRDIQTDMDDAKSLNLNALTLADNRKNVYEAFQKSIEIKCKGLSEEASKTVIKKLLQKYLLPDELGQLPEYCGIIRYQFRKHINIS